MTLEVLDPTYEEDEAAFSQANRLMSLDGATIGIVSNGKQGTGRFFDALSERLRNHHGVAHVERLVKPNYSAPAGPDIMDATSQWNALISGIGD